MGEEQKEFMDALRDHSRTDEKNFDAINHNLTVIKENHLTHIERSTAQLSTDISWIKKLIWLVAGAIIAWLINDIFNLL